MSHSGVKRRHFPLPLSLDEERKELADTSKEEIKEPRETVAIERGGQSESDEEMNESDVKRRKLMTDPLVECPICMNELSTNQLHILPCLNIICRSCGMDLIRQNEHIHTIRCPGCTKDHILAHPDVVMDATVVMDQCPTMKQSQQRSAVLFASHKPSKHPPHCCKCDLLATHSCKDGCGLFCDEHDTSIHQLRPGHQCESLIEIEEKQATKRVQRVEQAKQALKELDTIKAQWVVYGSLKLKHHNHKKAILKSLNSDLKLVNDILVQCPVWIKSLTDLIEMYSNEDEDFDGLMEQVSTQKEKIIQFILMSHSPSSEMSDDACRRLLDLSDRADDLDTEERWVKKPPFVQTHPIITFARELKERTLLSALRLTLMAKLQSLLTESGKSVANAKLLYKSTFDGWSQADFVRQCQGKSHTLLIVEMISDEVHYLFGAYIAPAWPKAGKDEVPDPSMKSFIFSLTNPYDHPIRLSLTKPNSVVNVATEVAFGEEVKDESGESIENAFPNLMLFYAGRSANHPRGIVINDQNDATFTYQLDEESKRSAPPGFKLDCNTFGCSQFCGASEIEVYQL